MVNQDILNFDTDKTFDIVIAFGVMNFFSTTEAEKLYKKFFKFTAPGGTLIIKNQMGVSEDVIVDKYSEELGHHYYSEYRTALHESKLISASGFSINDVHDIYPDQFNRWPNTRFKCIVSSKVSTTILATQSDESVPLRSIEGYIPVDTDVLFNSLVNITDLFNELELLMY